MERAYDMAGRTAAAGGTKDRIAAAALELFLEHDYDAITLGGIAKAARVSHQTVLNHCGSKAGAVLAAGELFGERVAALQSSATPGDVASVVRAVAARYEALGDANARWGALGPRLPEVAEALARGRASHRAWLQEHLGDHLPQERKEHERVLNGLHAALDVHTWKLLRRDLGLSRKRTEEQLTDLVLGVLARHRS